MLNVSVIFQIMYSGAYYHTMRKTTGLVFMLSCKSNLIFSYNLLNDALESSDYTASSNLITTTYSNVQYYDYVKIYCTWHSPACTTWKHYHRTNTLYSQQKNCTPHEDWRNLLKSENSSTFTMMFTSPRIPCIVSNTGIQPDITDPIRQYCKRIIRIK